MKRNTHCSMSLDDWKDDSIFYLPRNMRSYFLLLFSYLPSGEITLFISSLQISRDCQELEPSVGEQLASLLYLEPDSDLMVLKLQRSDFRFALLYLAYVVRKLIAWIVLSCCWYLVIRYKLLVLLLRELVWCFSLVFIFLNWHWMPVTVIFHRLSRLRLSRSVKRRKLRE